MRYLIASLLDPRSDTSLRQAYLAAFAQPCPVRTLHLTFIPPFTTTNLDPIISLLNSLTPPPLIYTPQNPAIFNRHRQILYLPLKPVSPLKNYFSTLLPQIKHFITFATTDFPSNYIPDFLPHITLNYDFNHHGKNLFQPPLDITLLPPTLLYEADPGIWLAT